MIGRQFAFCPALVAGFVCLGMVVARAAAPEPAAGRPSPRIGNGGFEAGLTAPWGTGQYAQGHSAWWNNLDGHSNAEADRQIRHGGLMSLHVRNRSRRAPEVYGTTQQPVAIEPGERYRIALWARGVQVASDGAVSIVVDEAWKVRPIRLPKGTYDWTRFAGEFSLPTGTAQLRILAEDVCDVWIDDITIEAAPTAGSASGAIASGGARPDSGRGTPARLNLPAEATVAGPVTPEAGATVALPDGAQVRIPPGALAAPATLTATKLRVTGPDAACAAAYEFTLSPAHLALKAPATLVLPFDAASVPGGDPGRGVKVALLVSDQGWAEVPAAVDRAAGKAVVKTDHFSTYQVYYPNTWASHSLDKGPVILRVPYYPQDGAGWCWAASTQMLLKYYGRDTEIWSIAESFGADYTTGLNAGNFLRGLYAAYLAGHGLQVEQSHLGWVDATALTGYVKYQLRQGRPVWLAAANAGHAVVVVGFDETGMYINDPSGFLFDFAHAKADDGHMAVAHIASRDWFRALDANFFSKEAPLGMKQTLVVVNARPSAVPPLTMSVLSRDVQFRIPRPKDVGASITNDFQWDGTKKPHGHCFVGLDTYPPAMFVGTPDNNPGNADTLSKFTVSLANSLDEPAQVSVLLLLDGQKLREQKLTVPPRSSNVELDLMEKEPYAFQQHPLRPGPHQFQLALSKDGQVVDFSNIHFVMGPAVPSGFKAERLQGHLAKMFKLSWDPNPEARAGWAKITYDIWADGKWVSRAGSNSWVHELPEDNKEHKYQVEAAVDTQPRLSSHLTPAVKVTGQPPEPARAALRGSGTWQVHSDDEHGSGPISLAFDPATLDISGDISGTLVYGAGDRTRTVKFYGTITGTYVGDAGGGKLHFKAHFDPRRVSLGANQVALNLAEDFGQADFRGGKVSGWFGMRLGRRVTFEFPVRGDR